MGERNTSGQEKATLPAGNVWEFSDRNYLLTPKHFLNEYRDLTETSEVVCDLVLGLSERFIQPGWEFASVMGRDGVFANFAIVFVNKERKEITNKRLEPDFLRMDGVLEAKSGKNVWLLPNEHVNNLLRGTNLYAENVWAYYNNFEREVRRGIFRKQERIRYYQSGVAYLYANLRSVDDEVRMTDAGMDQLNKELEAKIEEARKQLEPRRDRLAVHKDAVLALKTDNPKPLFGSSKR